MEQWISANKAKKIFKINDEKLDELEKQGKVKTIQSVGNKLYLLSNLSTQGIELLPQKETVIKKNTFKKIFSDFLSLFGFGK